MTNQLRTSVSYIPNPVGHMENITTGTISNIPAYGAAYTTQTYISVRWPWFIVSLVLLLCGLAFLIGAVVVTRRVKTAPWKNSVVRCWCMVLTRTCRINFLAWTMWAKWSMSRKRWSWGWGSLLIEWRFSVGIEAIDAVVWHHRLIFWLHGSSWRRMEIHDPRILCTNFNFTNPQGISWLQFQG